MSNYVMRIQWLKERKEYDILLAELRCRESPEHRLEAGRMLLTLGHSKAFSWLLNAVLYDPDPGVRNKLYEALKDQMGGDLILALRVEGADGVSMVEPWLGACQLRGIQLEGTLSPRMASPLIGHRLQDLLETLEYSLSAEARLSAALDLANLGDFSCLLVLRRVAEKENDPDVCNAILYAVEQIHGMGDRVEAEGEDQWFSESVEEDSPITQAQLAEQELRGMILVAIGNRDTATRIKAIHYLQKNCSVGVVSILAQLMLQEPDQQVQKAAREVLEDLLGDELPDYLQHLKQKIKPDVA